MGFSGTPPRLDTATVIAGIDRWSTRAEIATIHEELPWTDLLAGMSPDAILDRDKVQLVQYYRGKGLQLFFMADLTDGLAREKEAPQLRALGRSLSETVGHRATRNGCDLFRLCVNRGNIRENPANRAVSVDFHVSD